ncbi:hypothetical protein WR25_08259 [Diploscapter pachys]|uniref:RGS domain-containing protein n=1 Tax=Diploscapter pachys TaxID=2018661 RepID=A0A2A2LHF2_9BILA|nr:hypothetical protein WR25_08259 [Diploscapter pachys]
MHFKLDALMRRLLEGVQLKSHKYFRITVPQALTGTQLVSLLMDKGHFDDDTEAAHMASVLISYGYLFNVMEENPVVKDDNSLYRIQRPYFWPSHCVVTDNVEYAIYLNKRLLRNEEKHGLEPEEVEHFNRLAELLAHMWQFITQQAEMQLKYQKEKKKQDKVVFDSEERAFWRLRKPGVQNALEQHVQKTERKIRKANTKDYRSLVDRLKFSLKTKPWLKALKASDTMVSWVEQRSDYDPFLTQPHPSNPWLTDDTTLWTLNTDTVEVPTERRVKRWGLSIQELVLETFLESEFSSENIRFWIAVQDLKASPNEQIESKMERIYDEFLGPGAPAQVNVDSRTLEQTIDCIKNADTPAARRHAFSNSEEHVFTLMAKDSYPRFVKSQIYKGVLSAAQQQGNKRLGWRNFVFNMGATKKPLGSKQPKSQANRDESGSSNQPLPKQLSSDSLPVRPHVK